MMGVDVIDEGVDGGGGRVVDAVLIVVGFTDILHNCLLKNMFFEYSIT